MAKLEDVIRRGTTASKPAATAVAVGTLYFDTDLDKMQRSDGSNWQDVERADPSAATFAGVRVTHSTTQSIGSSSQTAINFDTEAFDTDAYHSTVSNTSRLTVPSGKNGKYLIGGSGGVAANATGARQLSIRLNGTTYLCMEAQPASSGSSFRTVLSTVYDLAVSDYVELMVFQTSGGNLNTVNSEGLPNFWMYKVG